MGLLQHWVNCSVLFATSQQLLFNKWIILSNLVSSGTSEKICQVMIVLGCVSVCPSWLYNFHIKYRVLEESGIVLLHRHITNHLYRIWDTKDAEMILSTKFIYLFFFIGFQFIFIFKISSQQFACRIIHTT